MSSTHSDTNMSAAFLDLIATPDLPGLGPDRRSSAKTASEINATVRAWAHDEQLDADTLDVLRSAALLWHDHLHPSHSISQSIPTTTGSFLHGIMHRREPDYGNAKYWFHRVHFHPAYSDISQAAQSLLAQAELPASLSHLVPNGDWDAFGFVDAVEQALGSKADPAVILGLQRVQQVEFECMIRKILR